MTRPEISPEFLAQPSQVAATLGFQTPDKRKGRFLKDLPRTEDFRCPRCGRSFASHSLSGRCPTDELCSVCGEDHEPDEAHL